MGNTMSQCKNNYPKNKWLQPHFVVSVGMAGVVGSKFMAKEAIRETAADNFKYLLSLSSLAGSQFWFMFISGKALFDSIPRIQYAKAEAKLSPTFSVLATVLSGVAAAIYLKRHPFALWTSNNCKFGWCVLVSFAMNELNSTCFTPQTLRLYKRMMDIEQQAGVSPDQMGCVDSGNQLLANDSTYNNIKQRFQLMHSLLATTSFISFGCSIAQLYFLCFNSVFSF